MKYTVNDIAKLSGVSVRTLHWYDRLGLLKPSCYGQNNYRYYGEEQLLSLQQILFFRELGFTLKAIQKLLTQDNFDQLTALRVQKELLVKEINRKNQLIQTIDKTMLHIKGEIMISDTEFYEGFDPEKQKEYSQYLVTRFGHVAEDLLLESKKRTAKWDHAEWEKVKTEGDALYKALAQAIEQDLAPESEEVQELIHQHYLLQGRFYDLTKEVYLGLAQLYVDHPDFKKYFDAYHPKMVDFVCAGIKIYGQKL